MEINKQINYEQALEKLKQGNRFFSKAIINSKLISNERRISLLEEGQKPYAIIITCSDSRVVPEHIFMTGLGELFVIRVAGNVIDNHQLGSIEYAAEHLHTPIIVVLGHTHCGAVDAALNNDPQGYIKFITEKIKLAIGSETDPYLAAYKNVKYCVDEIEASLSIKNMENHQGLHVIPAIYHLENGKVIFFD